MTKFFLYPVLLVFFCSCSDLLQFKTSLSPIQKGWSRTMVNATIFRSNSLASFNGYQYAAYYDSSSNVVLAKRRLGSNEWRIHRTQYTGNTLDAHNSINLAIDAIGFLHLAWDHHDSKLNYCRSREKESLEMGSREVMIGANEDVVTYSEFYRLRRGNLLFVYREGSSGSGNMVMNRYDAKTKTWTRVQNNLISGEDQRNAYWQLTVDNSGSIHVSWVWREDFNVETNHDICYAVSNDDGKTWYKSTGEKYSLPITLSTSEFAMKIPIRSDLINQTSMTVDRKGRPYIATYFHSPSDRCPQYYIVYKDKTGWHNTRVTDRKSNFTLAGLGTRSIPISRPKILYLREKGKDFLLMLYRDEERSDRVCLAWTSITNIAWQTVELTDFSVDRWEPTIDPYLWRRMRLHVFVQSVGQESGEVAAEKKPQMVNVLQVGWK
jgi:hypothetical protein